MTPDSSQLQHSEVAGSFLQAMMLAWKHPGLLEFNDIQTPPDDLEAERWYPFSLLTQLVEDVRKALPDCHALLFDAGVSFTYMTHHYGVAKGLMFCTPDWIELNREGAGYLTVVRGPTEEVGWGRMLSHDEQAGIAVYENVMPLRAEFLQGVYYGGCDLFDDVDYYRADVVESSQMPDNPHLWRTVIALHYRLTPARVDPQRLARAAQNQIPASELSLEEIASLTLRMQLQQEKLQQQRRYFDEVSTLLTSTISIAQQQRDEMERLANRDSLTGLASLRCLREQMMAEIDNTESDRPITVFYLDLNGFKPINDEYGHAAGDLVLSTIGQRLKKFVKPDELAARIGGDEFVLLLHRSSDAHQLALLHQQISDQIERPVDIPGQRLHISAGIGWAVHPIDGNSMDDLLRHADRYMYQHKQQQR